MKQNLLKLLKNPKLYLIIFCSALIIFSTRHALSINSVGHSLIVFPIVMLVYLGLIWLYFRLRRRQAPAEKLFLLFAIPLGILFLIFLPPGESPDEISHFKRAYAITEGSLVSEVYDETGHAGSKLPQGFQESLIDTPKAGTYATVISKLGAATSDETNYMPYNNTALYHWLCYLPQVIGILIGKVFGASLELLAYFAEIVDFVVWLILIFFAIKLAPKFKTVIMFITLLPITLQEATSLAPDALAIGLGIFLTAYVCHLTYVKKTKLKPLEIILLYAMAIMVGYCKIVYLPLVALYLIIPTERFGSKRAKWLHAAALAILLLILNLSWLAASSKFLFEFNPGVNSGEQISGILHNPFRYAMTLFNSLNVMGQFYLSSFLGMNLGSFTFNLPSIIFFISFAVAILLFAQRDESLKIKSFERVVFGATFCLVSLLVFTSIYIQWSPVGLAFVDGVQGRYFLSIILLVPLALARPHEKPSDEAKRTIISLDTVACYSLAVDLIAVVTFFAGNI